MEVSKFLIWKLKKGQTHTRTDRYLILILSGGFYLPLLVVRPLRGGDLTGREEGYVFPKGSRYKSYLLSGRSTQGGGGGEGKGPTTKKGLFIQGKETISIN